MSRAARELPPWKISGSGLGRLRLQRVIRETVEIAAEREALLGPDPTQRPDELFRAPVAFVVIEPGLADRGELAAEPARDDIDRNAALSELADGCDLLGRDRRIPRTGKQRRDHLQLRRRREQRVAEGDRLVLEFGAVSGGEADLAQRVIESRLLRDLRQATVVIDVPSGSLLDLADHEPPGDVRHPVSEFDRIVVRSHRNFPQRLRLGDGCDAGSAVHSRYA